MTRIKHDRSADGIVTPCKSAPLEKVLTWRQSLRLDASRDLRLIVVRSVERKAIIYYSIGRAERMQQEDTFLRDRLEDCLNHSMSPSGMVEIPRLEAKLSFRNGRLILERSRP
jgi:hypothetical protein